MASKKGQKRNFNGMSYVEVQRDNSEKRNKLKNEEKKWLKDNGYRNIGWNNIIKLYQKIEEFLGNSPFKDTSLEELFLEADRIGNKYLSYEETTEFNQQLSKEVSEIGELIDKQFPDAEIEAIDFSQNTVNKSQRKRGRKVYRTAKV